MKIKNGNLFILVFLFLIGIQTDLRIEEISNSVNINQYNYYGRKKLNKLEDECMVFNEPSFNDIHVTCDDSEKKFNGDTELFHFTSSVKIDNILSLGNIELLSYEIKEEKIVCKLSKFIQNENISLQFYSSDILVDNFTLYFASDIHGNIFSSSFSLDTAKRNAGQTLNYDLIDDETTLNNNGEISQKGLGITGITSGTFRWTDDQGKIHPLIGAKVMITIGGSSRSSTTYTNQTGFYSFNYKNIWYVGTGKPKITVFTDNGESVKVSNNGTYAMTKEMSGTNGNFSYSYTFSPNTDGDMGKSIIIFQAAKNFADYAETMNGGNPITLCTFKYPGDPNKSSNYNRNNVVTISSALRKNPTYPNSYSSWDVIGHEYGHHVQKCYGLTSNPGGNHAIGSNNIDAQYDIKKDDNITRKYTLKESKDRGLKLAWGEGCATY